MSDSYNPNYTGWELIMQERSRQQLVEGFNAAHDDNHQHAELAHAATIYAFAAGCMARGGKVGWINKHYLSHERLPRWPFADDELKLSNDPVVNLIKAGALIAAEIDRLLRARRMRNPTPNKEQPCP